MPYIDAHSHIWTDDTGRYPISPEYTKDQMEPPTFTPEELLALAHPCDVDRVVLIQMSYYGTDNAYMLDAIAAQPEVFRGVAIADYMSPDLGEEMARLREGGVRGFRVYHYGPGPETPLDSAAMRPLCGLASELDMAVCPLTDPEHLGIVANAAADFPGTTFVVDHMGRVGCGRPFEEAHIQALCDLGAWPNVCVKLSAFYALGAAQAPYDDLAPFIRRVWQAFGSERMMWATDCPFQAIQGGYSASIELVRDRLDFLTDADRQQILAGTAERVFFGL